MNADRRDNNRRGINSRGSLHDGQPRNISRAISAEICENPRPNLKEWKGIWVFAEQEESSLSEISLELLSAAQILAGKKGETEISALLLGHGVKALADQLMLYGADRVFLADHSSLAKYMTLPYTRVVCELIRRKKPEIFLLPATSLGSDLASRVAARINTGLSAHCTQLDINEQGELMQVVPAFGGKVMATILCRNHRPQMATVRPGVFPKGEPRPREGTIEDVAVEIKLEDENQKVVASQREKKPSQSIEEAEVVVAGGAGIGSREDWKWLESLAENLGGAVGGTRPPLDEGWISEGQMIGQSGKTIRPKLYIGVGISGVIQHVVGIQDAKMIIAINNDPQAAIFQTADLGVVSDFRQIIPLLIEEIKKGG